jgi:hypothetical protein
MPSYGQRLRYRRLPIRLLAGVWFAVRRYVRIYQRGRAGRTRDRVVCPLPQAPQRFGVAERDSGLQMGAVLHLGQIHDRIDQARPAARGDMPRRRVQRCPRGSVGFRRSCHLGSGDHLITIFDLNMPGRTGIGHEMPPAGIAVACRNNYTGPNPLACCAASRPGTQRRRCRRPSYRPAQPARHETGPPDRQAPDGRWRSCSGCLNCRWLPKVVTRYG